MATIEERAKTGGDGSDRRLRLAIAGFGTVGSAVARILIEQGAASPFEVAYILNRRIKEKRVDWVPTSVRWTDNIDEVLDSNIDVLVELIGGCDIALEMYRSGELKKLLSEVAEGKGVSRESLNEAIKLKYDHWIRGQNKPSALPPRA